MPCVCRGLRGVRGQRPLHRGAQRRPPDHPPRPPVRDHRVSACGGAVHLQVQPPQGDQGGQPCAPPDHYSRRILYLQHGELIESTLAAAQQESNL